jgi:iron complex transport system permease protein
MAAVSNTIQQIAEERRVAPTHNTSCALAVLLVMLTLVAVVSLTIGTYRLSLHDWWSVLTAPAESGTAGIVLWQVRLPRVLAAMLVGGGLSLAGAAYQGLFNNPMVSPDILGASAGAGFGAALGILCGFHVVAIQGMSFAMGLVAVGLAWFIGAGLGRRGDPVLMLVLVGILVSSVFTALITLTKYLADPMNAMQAITFWLLGSFASINPKDVKLSAIPILCLGEEEARTLGLNTRWLRLIVIIAATLITAASVSICGMVGWIGLVVPHLARMVVGPNYKVLVPTAALMGACFLLLVDDVARTAAALEIPVGILTALIGAPFFLFLLMRERRGLA